MTGLARRCALLGCLAAAAGGALAQGTDAVPTFALSCVMESPAEYRNHVVSIAIFESAKSATVQGRPAREVGIEYLRFVIQEDKVRWVVDRGTGRVSMFTLGASAPALYGNGVCQLIKERKF